MATYPIEDYKLELNADLTELKVIRRSSNATEATVALSSAQRLMCENGDYDISATTMPTGFYQLYDTSEGDTLVFTDSEGLGISDLRTVRSSFTYYLTECPLVMQVVDGKLKVQSPCQSPCTAPLTACCRIVEI